MSAIPTSVTQEHITDANGFILASPGLIAGHHHGAFDMKDNLRAAFKFSKGWGMIIAGLHEFQESQIQQLGSLALQTSASLMVDDVRDLGF